MTTVPSSSAALTVFSHSACHAGLESAAMEVFGDETPRQNSRVQRNVMMNRVGSDKRILWFTEVIPDSAAFISCLEPGQEEINPHLAGLGTVWNLIGMIRLIEILPAQLALRFGVHAVRAAEMILESSPLDWNRLLLSDLRSFSAGRDLVSKGSEGLPETESSSGPFINKIPMRQLTPERFVG